MARYISEKKWKLQKMLMSILLPLFPVLGTWFVWLRDWRTLAPINIGSVSVDVICMIILIFLFWYTVRNQADNSLKTGCFATLVALNATQLFVDLITVCVNNIPKLRWVNLISNDLFYYFGLVMVRVFWMYLLELAEMTSPQIEKLSRILRFLGHIAAAAVIFSLVGRYYFDVTADGTYCRGKYFYFSYAYILLIVLSFFMLLWKMKMERKKKAALLSFIIVPVLATLLQIAFYGTSLMYVGTLIALFMIYGNIFMEQNEELIRQKFENTRKEQEIMLARQRQQLIDADLNLAWEIQNHMIPRVFPESEAFSICADMIPAKSVGGDFYDFFNIDADHMALVIADVSGKGVPAALYMMTVKTMIKNAATQKMEPKDILEFVNRQLCENPDEVPMFVTVWLGVLEISSRKLTAANAGHEYPALLRKDGQFELYKDRHGFVLGGMESMRYRQYELALNPGDTLFVYTDGVTEATSPEEELFGTDRMLSALNTDPHVDPETLLKQVKASLDAFVEDGDQFDDITMMAIRMSEPPMTVKTIKIVPTEESMAAVQTMAEELMDETMVPMKIAMKMSIAIDEIYSNIIRYSKAQMAEVTFRVSSEALELIFMDDGVPYNPLEAETPDITLSAEERNEGGLGILITRNIMDAVDYVYKDGRNQIRLMKKL